MHFAREEGGITMSREYGDKLLQTVYNTLDVVEEARDECLEVLMADVLMKNPKHEHYIRDLLEKQCTCKRLNQKYFKNQQQGQPLLQPPSVVSIPQPQYMPGMASQLGQPVYFIGAPMMTPQPMEIESMGACQTPKLSLNTGPNQQENQKQAGNRCVFCDKAHHRYQLFCPVLKILQPHKIWRIVKKNGITCHMCLGIDHDLKSCEAIKNGSLKKCSIQDDQGIVCGQLHCRFLHQFNQKEPSNSMED